MTLTGKIPDPVIDSSGKENLCPVPCKKVMSGGTPSTIVTGTHLE